MSTADETQPFSADEVEPESFFSGRLLITAPHQDDCVLACGATLARLGGGDHIHVAYATDGAASPAPLIPWHDARPRDLGRIRMDEAREAMGRLGIPVANVHFLNFSDGRLRDHMDELGRALRQLAERIAPNHVLAPFRYDRHPDHLALNRVVLLLFGDAGDCGAKVTEYFIYHQTKLLPKKDMRAYIRPGALRQVVPRGVVDLKRSALDCFRSQTTRFYEWQTRPNLSPQLLDAVSIEPEVFLRYDPAFPGDRILIGPKAWILIAHRLEPVLKRRKDQLVALLKRGLGERAGPDAQSRS